MIERLTADRCLPEDHSRATLVGRVWQADVAGPTLVVLRGDRLFDLSRVAPTCAQLLNLADPVAAIRRAESPRLPRGGSDLLR